MTIHQIVYIPTPVLLKPAAKVEVFDEALRQLIQDMFETMEAARGIGLAAPQIGIAKQIAVIDKGADGKQPWVLINPVVSHLENFVGKEEGCLSIPGCYYEVPRALRLSLTAQDEFGKSYTVEAEERFAHVIQHEVDHLNGKVYIHYLSKLKQNLAQKKVNKYIRLNTPK